MSDEFFVATVMRHDSGEGLEEAWAAARKALPRDAYIFHLAADGFMGATEPSGWEVFAHCERRGWRRQWVGRGETPAEALRDLADFTTQYPGE